MAASSSAPGSTPLHQDGAGHQRLARGVAAQYRGLGKAQPPGEVFAQSLADQAGVCVSHPVLLRCFKDCDDALAAGGADGNEAACRPAVDGALGLQHLGEGSDDAPAGGSERMAGGQG